MGDMMVNKYLACIELSTREGNLRLPILPDCEVSAFLRDTYTDTKVPVTFNKTNIVRIFSKTCGSLQWLDVADMLLWSSFEPGRFTLYVERADSQSESQSESACQSTALDI